MAAREVSAAYATEDGVELRLAVALKPDTAAVRGEVMNAFAAAAGHIDTMIEGIGYRVDGRIDWEFGGKHLSKRAAWLNKLAGV